MKATCPNPPRVLITPEAKQRLDMYISLCNEEISGLGRVSRFGNDFLIEEVLLFSQEVTAGSTDLEEEDVSNFLLESVQAGLDPANLKLWWHSHVNGGCFWSGTDEGTAGRFANGWMISVVGNKRGEYKVRIDLYEPVRITVDELDLQVYQAENFELRTRIQAEIAQKVRRKVVIQPASRFAGFQGGSPHQGGSFCERTEAEVGYHWHDQYGGY